MGMFIIFMGVNIGTLKLFKTYYLILKINEKCNSSLFHISKIIDNQIYLIFSMISISIT